MNPHLGNLGYIHRGVEHITYHPDEDAFESKRGIKIIKITYIFKILTYIGKSSKEFHWKSIFKNDIFINTKNYLPISQWIDNLGTFKQNLYIFVLIVWTFTNNTNRTITLGAYSHTWVSFLGGSVFIVLAQEF